MRSPLENLASLHGVRHADATDLIVYPLFFRSLHLLLLFTLFLMISQAVEVNQFTEVVSEENDESDQLECCEADMHDKDVDHEVPHVWEEGELLQRRSFIVSESHELADVFKYRHDACKRDESPRCVAEFFDEFIADSCKLDADC